jgi:hypothetical protein
MDKLSWARKLASLLLLLCFVLPLSQCTTKFDKDGKPGVQTSTLYPGKLAQEALATLSVEKLDGAAVLFGIFTVFLLPALCWRMRPGRQALLLAAASGVAGFALYLWVFLFATAPLAGGLLASACWIVLAACSAVVLWRRWRGWRARRRAVRYGL